MAIYPYPLVLVNPDAETGDTSGWTSDAGTSGIMGVRTWTDVDGEIVGDYIFVASLNGASPSWGQTTPLPLDILDDVEAGLYSAKLRVRAKTYAGDSDYGDLYLLVLDGSGSPIVNKAIRISSDIWETYTLSAQLPPTAAAIRIGASHKRASGNECSVYYNWFDLELVEPIEEMGASGIELPLINGNAEMGNTTGWTVYRGNMSATTGASAAGSVYGFVTPNAANSEWGQVVDVPAEYHAEIDAGLLWVKGTADVRAYTDYDCGRLGVRCRDAAGNILGTARYSDWYEGSEQIFIGSSAPIPPNTRKVEIFTDNVRQSGTELSVYWDNFRLYLTGIPSNDRDLPHRYWKLHMTSRTGGSNYGFNHLAWNAASGPVDGTFIASSSSGLLSYLEGLKVDNTTPTTFYRLESDGSAWIVFDAGEPVDIVSLTAKASATLNDSMRNFSIWWSDDNCHFVEDCRFRDARGWVANEYRTFKRNTDRYRIYFRRNIEGAIADHATLSEIELMTSADGPDLTFPCGAETGLGGHCFGAIGDSASGVRSPAQAFDGNLTATNWVGGGSPYWHEVEWHFDDPVELTHMALTPRSSQLTQGPRYLEIRRSQDNGFTYSLVSVVNQNAFTTADRRVVDIRTSSIQLSNVGMWAVEGPRNSTIQLHNVGMWAVEGPPYNTMQLSNVGLWVVEGPPVIPPMPRTDAGGHRYWRIFNRRNKHANILGMRAFAFYAGGVELTGYGGTVIAGGGTPVSSWVNLPSGTDFFYTGTQQHAFGEWVGYDFGAESAPRIDQVNIMPSSDTTRTPYLFEVQWSDDGIVWNSDWYSVRRTTHVFGAMETYSRPIFPDDRVGQYWMINITQQTGNYIAAAEIEYRAEEDGTSLNSGKTGVGWCSHIDSGSMNNLNDNNLTTFWANASVSARGTEYVGIDLGALVEVREIVWTQRASYPNQTPQAGTVLRSMDGDSYMPAWQFSGWTTWTGTNAKNSATTHLPPVGSGIVRYRRNAVQIIY